MENIKLVLCQVNAKRNIGDNLDKAIECITKAKDLGADIVLFPEMFSNGII